MRFESPEWFLLVFVFAAVAVFFPVFGLRRPLRITSLALLVLALAGLKWRQAGDGLDVWLLLDRSESVTGNAKANVAECEKILERSRGARDRLHIVDFAADPLLRSEGDGTSVYPADTGKSRLAEAVRFALSRADSARATRLLAVTDRLSTDTMEGLAERLVRERVALDVRLVPGDRAGDCSVRRFNSPARVRAGESFILGVEVAGPEGKPVTLELLRDGVSLGTSRVALGSVPARLRFTDRAGRGGAYRYEARLVDAADAFPGNDHAAARVEVVAGPRVLLVTAYADDPLAESLRAAGTDLEIIDDPARASVGRLSGARAVILNNVPAYRLPSDFVNALEFYVSSQGGGLLMAGGRTSFASGGWFGTPVEAALPVSMELRQEHRKLSLAMAVVLDRSGSMSCGVPGGLQKMDLADAGAARTIELLGDNDEVALFATDTQAHEMAPLTRVGSARQRLVDVARRIKSSGGGICVPTGLRAAHKVLKESKSGTRHVIVFADANDATQESPDPAQLEAMRKDGITVSCIGLGRDTDSGGAYLRQVAAQGGGRVFFNENPGDLPAMFSQETAAVARSAFIDKPVPAKASSGWAEISARAPVWPVSADAYNLCYLKPGATGALYTEDEYKAPLVAFRRHGAGRTAAVTFPLAGDFSERTRAWAGYPDFLRTLVHWLEGEGAPAGASLRVIPDAASLAVEFRHDASWSDRLARHAPVLRVVSGKTTTPTEVAWEKMAPGCFRTVLPLDCGEVLRGAVLAGDSVLPFGPVETSVNPEWEVSAARVEAWKSVSRASGGEDRTDLPAIWRAPRRESWRDLSPWLLAAWFLVFLTDAFVSHTGWRPRRFAWALR